LSDALVSVLMV